MRVEYTKGERASNRMLKKPLFSPAHPGAQDAPFTRQRSRIAQRLNVPKRTTRLFARCGLARDNARLGALGLGGCEVWPF
jgi:hypothetical protein